VAEWLGSGLQKKCRDGKQKNIKEKGIHILETSESKETTFWTKYLVKSVSFVAIRKGFRPTEKMKNLIKRLEE